MEWNPQTIKGKTFFKMKKELKIKLSQYAEPHWIIAFLTMPPRNIFYVLFWAC